MPDYRTLFERLLELSSHATLVLDTDRRVIHANDAAARVSGVATEALARLRLDDLLDPAERLGLDDDFGAPGARLVRRRARSAMGPPVALTIGAAAVDGGHRLAFLWPTVSLMPRGLRDCPEVAATLTPQQAQIATLLAFGGEADQIAGLLFLSTEAVRTQVRDALAETRTHTQAELVALAIGRGWIPFPGPPPSMYEG